ncbi:unnamed protein product [Phyllotreta striolata]|uniref:Synaptic plasticity regulator PANTS n=1 Tax=Phyllotreta striolata TaxID=444603 RepID=A0A9N9TX83_PHYSR|nr:unnamed protein product [Phyllotreta striolata]
MEAEANKDSNNDSNETENKTKIQDEWLIRRCFIYDEEYKDCTSFRARFHQYFIHGKTVDCSQWKRDSINCYKYMESQDESAANELVQSEKNRRRERLMSHYSNDVWKKRKSPPENWNEPLPDYISKDYENSYLSVKSKEMKGELPASFDINYRCNIL